MPQIMHLYAQYVGEFVMRNSVVPPFYLINFLVCERVCGSSDFQKQFIKFQTRRGLGWRESGLFIKQVKRHKLWFSCNNA